MDLAEVMETSLRTVMARSGRADLEVVTRMDPTLPPRILGDRERLRQVLLKLVDNAVKFTHRGGRVELLAARLGDRVRFEVRDTGVGISGEKLDLVFEPFTQADNSSTRSYGGMGMGLALCQGLIALMGGELTVESKVGHGSVFRFDVPVRAALSLEPFQRVYQAADIRPLRILLVEDNVVNQVVAEGLLSEWGHQVTMAEHGQAALRLLTREHEFDLVFMDLQMPVMDGLQATLELRLRERNWERPVVPVVALTAHGTSQDEESCRLAGMNGFLRKPVVAADFLQCLGGLFASD